VPSLFKVTAIPKKQKKEKALVDSNLLKKTYLPKVMHYSSF
jgi:hypothetical protein